MSWCDVDIFRVALSFDGRPWWWRGRRVSSEKNEDWGMRRRAHDAISIIASAKISIFYSLPCFRCKLPRSRPSNRDGWDGEREEARGRSHFLLVSFASPQLTPAWLFRAPLESISLIGYSSIEISNRKIHRVRQLGLRVFMHPPPFCRHMHHVALHCLACRLPVWKQGMLRCVGPSRTAEKGSLARWWRWASRRPQAAHLWAPSLSRYSPPPPLLPSLLPLPQPVPNPLLCPNSVRLPLRCPSQFPKQRVTQCLPASQAWFILSAPHSQGNKNLLCSVRIQFASAPQPFRSASAQLPQWARNTFKSLKLFNFCFFFWSYQDPIATKNN